MVYTFTRVVSAANSGYPAAQLAATASLLISISHESGRPSNAFQSGDKSAVLRNVAVTAGNPLLSFRQTLLNDRPIHCRRF